MVQKIPLDYATRGFYHIAMRSRFILPISCLVTMATIGQRPAAAQTRREASLPNAIVLFGAHWCAPCRGEYRILPKLVAAAAPSRLVLAWIDRSVIPPAGIAPGALAVLGLADAQVLADRVGGEGYGLPFAAMFDNDGRVCSLWQRPLTPENIGMLRAACRR